MDKFKPLFPDTKSFAAKCALNKFEIQHFLSKQYFVWFLFVVSAYFLSAFFSLLFTVEDNSISAIWFASGVGFIVVYAFGYRVWPAIFIGAFFAYISHIELDSVQINSLSQIYIAVINASINTLEAVFGVYLIRKLIGLKSIFSTIQSAVSFIVLIAFFVSFLAAFVGTFSSVFISKENSYFIEALLNYWLSHALGIILIVPLILSWRMPDISNFKINQLPELFTLLTLFAIVAALIFKAGFNLAYLFLPLFIFFTYQFGRFISLIIAFILSLLSIWVLVYSNADWIWNTPEEGIFYLRLFLLILLLSIILVAAVLQDHAHIKERMQLYKKIIEKSKEGIAIFDSKGFYLEQNSAHEKMTAIADYEIENQTPAIHLGQEAFNAISLELSEKRISSGEWISNTKLGPKHIDLSAFSVFNDKNEIICNIEICQDISKQKETEKLLQKSEAEAGSLFKDAAIPIMIEDFSAIKIYIDKLIAAGLKDWDEYFVQNPKEINKLVKMIRVIDVNKRMVEIYGEGSKEKLLENLSSFFTEETLVVFKKEIIALAEGNFTFTSEIPSQDYQGNETHLILSLSIPPPYREKFNRVLVSFVDITKNKRDEKIQKTLLNISNAANKAKNVEETIKTVSVELGSIIDASNFFLALYDADNDEITLPFLRDMKNMPQKLPVGKTLTSLVIRNRKSLLLNQKEMKKLESQGIIEHIGLPSKIWLGVPLKIEDEVIGVFVVQSYTNENAYTHNDKETLEIITNQIALNIERKKAEEDVLNALEKSQESDRLKSAFLASMSHELRTPLNAIIGFSNLIEIDTEMEQEQTLQLIKMIHKSGNNLLQIVDSIFEVSLFHKGEVKIVNEMLSLEKLMNDIYENIINRQQMQNKTDVEIMAIHNSSIQHEIYTDGEKIKHIFIHLLSNALKFTNSGSISFGLDKIDKNKAYHFYVADTGIGIPEEKQAFIFDRFRVGDDTDARQYEGMGIGLFICKKLIEKLEGNIEVKSELNSGSRFSFYLPLQKKN